MEELISIIVPVYNVQNYLERCINSLIQQSYSNIEIILVDNMSTDKSQDICKKYELVCEKIKFYICKEKGASAARNYGINRSNGDYIVFVDADDYVEADYCKYLYEGIISNKADLCVCGIRRINEKNEIISELETTQVEKKFIEQSENLIIDLYNKNLFNFPTNKMYKKKKIVSLFDNTFQIGEDLLFNLKYIEQNNLSMCCIDKILYNYTVFNQLSKEKLMYYSENRLKSTIFLYKEMDKLGKMRKYSNDYFLHINSIYMDKILFCYKEWAQLGKSYKQYRKDIEKFVNIPEIQFLVSQQIKKDIKKMWILKLIKLKRIYGLSIILKLSSLIYSRR